MNKTRKPLTRISKSKWLIPTLIIVASLSIVAYAAVTSIPVLNNVTITTGANIQIIYQTAAIGTACPTTGYTTSPTGVSFSEPAGGAANTYLCINNVGSGDDTPTIAITAGDPDTCGTGTSPCFAVSPQSAPMIAPSAFSVPITLTISNSYTTAQALPVAITITVT